MNFTSTNLFWAVLLCLSSNVLFAHTSISPNAFGRENLSKKINLEAQMLMDTTPPVMTNIVPPKQENVGKECKTKVTILIPTVTDASSFSLAYNVKRKKDNMTILTATSQSSFDVAESNFGDYELTYIATDDAGNVANKKIDFKVNDTKKPTPICYHGLSVDVIPPTGDVWVGYDLFDAGSYDNCSAIEKYIQLPAPGLNADITKMTIDTSKNGKTSQDLPKNLAKIAHFKCVGPQTIALWVRDQAGNWDYCETYIEVQNNMGAPNVPNCNGWDPSNPSPKIIAKLTNQGIGEANGTLCFSDSTGFVKPLFPFACKQSVNGVAELLTVPYASGIVKITNDKNYLNGVSTLDLVLITKHILGTQLIPSSYAQIAADINNNGKISTADIVDLRKLILGLTTKFENNTSWQFFGTKTGSHAVKLVKIQKDTTLNFIGVKIGDINGNANGNKTSSAPLKIEIQDKIFKAGEEIIFSPKFQNIEKIDGYQATIFYDEKMLQLIDIEENKENFNFSQKGKILVSEVFGENQNQPTPLHFKALKNGILSKNIRFENSDLEAEVYHNNKASVLELIFESNNVAVADNSFDTNKNAFELYQNRPNPFSNMTSIPFWTEKIGKAKLTISDLNHRIIQTSEREVQKGNNQFEIDFSNAPKGLYFYKISFDGMEKTMKMVRF